MRRTLRLFYDCHQQHDEDWSLGLSLHGTQTRVFGAFTLTNTLPDPSAMSELDQGQIK